MALMVMDHCANTLQNLKTKIQSSACRIKQKFNTICLLAQTHDFNPRRYGWTARDSQMKILFPTES